MIKDTGYGCKLCGERIDVLGGPGTYQYIGHWFCYVHKDCYEQYKTKLESVVPTVVEGIRSW
jgi:hypothetical protein